MVASFVVYKKTRSDAFSNSVGIQSSSQASVHMSACPSSGRDRPMIDSFQAGCGLHGPIALVVSGPGRAPSAEPIVFDRPFVVIGRSESSCLQLDDDSVSYRHAYLQAVAG